MVSYFKFIYELLKYHSVLATFSFPEISRSSSENSRSLETVSIKYDILM